tara:strand:+ start:34 stop:378 length:345 start_codon:yes stop_codon:yes gene_type:complete
MKKIVTEKSSEEYLGNLISEMVASNSRALWNVLREKTPESFYEGASVQAELARIGLDVIYTSYRKMLSEIVSGMIDEARADISREIKEKLFNDKAVKKMVSELANSLEVSFDRY